MKLLFRIPLLCLIMLFCGGQTTQIFANEVVDGQVPGYLFYIVYLNDIVEEDASGRVSTGINFKFQSDSEVFQVAARRNGLSRGFRYVGPRKITFFEESSVDEEGEPMRKTLLQTDLGSPGDKIIVIVGSEGGLRSKVLDIGPSSFKPDHVRIINFSQQLVHAKVGEITHSVEPMNLFDYKVKGDSFRFLVLTALAAINGDQPYLIDKTRLSLRQGGRKLLVVHHDHRDAERLAYKQFSIPMKRTVKNVSDEDLKKIDVKKYYDNSLKGYDG